MYIKPKWSHAARLYSMEYVNKRGTADSSFLAYNKASKSALIERIILQNAYDV